MSLADARHYLTEGQFHAGSMGPEIEAAVRFLEAGGEYAVIGALDEAELVWSGMAGTIIRP